jgi:hypothetical protein
MTSEKAIIIWILQLIHKVFGETRLEWDNFTNCGIRHIRDPDGNVTLDQIEYINAIQPVVHTDLQTLSSEADASAALIELFMSIVGAAAFGLLTRFDAAIFICALQRMTSRPKVIHLKRINAVVRWMKANPVKLMYRPMKLGKRHLRCISDAAFKKEDDYAAFSIRGAVYVVAPGSASECGSGSAEASETKPGTQLNVYTATTIGHLIDYACCKIRHVSRAPFTSELFAGCDCMDQAMLLTQILHEVEKGPTSAAVARQMREQGGWSIPMVLYLDAQSVYAAIIATIVKVPAEKSLYAHLKYIRELLDNRVLEALVWIDTRDMTADGLTKGNVDRQGLHDLMSGLIKITKECKVWQPRRKIV